MDGLKGTITGNHGFYMFKPSTMGVSEAKSCKCSLHPIGKDFVSNML
jgi:hypothetical protein